MWGGWVLGWGAWNNSYIVAVVSWGGREGWPGFSINNGTTGNPRRRAGEQGGDTHKQGPGPAAADAAKNSMDAHMWRFWRLETGDWGGKSSRRTYTYTHIHISYIQKLGEHAACTTTTYIHQLTNAESTNRRSAPPTSYDETSEAHYLEYHTGYRSVWYFSSGT